MSRTSSLILLSIDGIGTALTLSAAIVFGVLGNYHAVFWCVLACTFAAANTYLRAVHYANKLEMWYSLRSITSVRDLGMCACIIISGYFFFVLFEIFYYHESVRGPISKSKIIVAVWCFISAKYAFTLFWVGRKYLHHLSETRSLLEQDD